MDVWESGSRDELTNVQSGPLATYADDLVIVQRQDQRAFLYTHYGANVAQSGGLKMLGKSTADFTTGVGAFFAESYHRALQWRVPVYAVNKAKKTHETHSWQRLLFPLYGEGPQSTQSVVAFVRPLALVSDVLSDFARDTGFLGGTLEPLVDDGRATDFIVLSLSDPVDVFGLRRMDKLSFLFGRALHDEEIDVILDAPDGTKALSIEIPNSMDRFGRIFVLDVTGSNGQPVFSLSDSTELVLARDASMKHQATMANYAEMASDWLWETDADNRFTMVTDAVFQKSGHRPDYYIGKDRCDLDSLPENKGRFDSHRRDIAERRPFRNFVYCSYAADGSPRWSRVNGVPQFDDDGNFLGYRGTGSNVTAEIEAKRALEERNKAMEDFAETASDWMWESDADHRLTMLTDAVEAQTGRPASYYIGRSRFAFADDPDNDAVFQAHRKDVEARRPFRDLIYKIKASDGSDQWLHVNGNPYFDQKGRFQGYRGTGSNITVEVEAKRQLEERKAAMEDFADTASDWMWETDVDHVFTMMSPAIEQFTGLSHTSFVGQKRFDLIGNMEDEEVVAAHRADIDARQPFNNFIYRVLVEGGRVMWARANGKPRFAEDGTFLGYRGTGTNITDEIEAREQAARRAEELAEAHRLGRLGGWSLCARTKQVVLSPEYLDLVGLPPERSAMSLDDALLCFSPDSRRLVQKSLRKVMRTKGHDTVDIEWIAGQSTSMDLSVVAHARQDAQGRVTEVFGTVQDITERKHAERQLQALAFHDPLTGLGNRSYFSRELDIALERAKQNDKTVGLLLLDLDHFKEVNDSLGHAAGDELLRRVSERLSLTIQQTGTVFRLGGDEFAIIVPDAGSAAELGALSASIISAFAGTVRLNEGAVHISTSVGMVMMPSQTGDPEEGMRFADLALYEAKNAGRNRALLFHAGLDETVQDRVNLARDLREAIRSDGLDAHFQLQVDVRKGKIIGFEALARWTHPTRGLIPPAKFIPIAESSRLIADLGAWMFGQVCRQGRAWLDAGGAPLEMAVNLSVAQLWHRDVESDILRALDDTGFPAELLCIELTESVFSQDALARIERLLARLKARGLQIALDDFGTGYSSLQYLNDLSFDKLKIDRSFVSGCDQSPEKQRLLQGIIGLGKGLGLHIVVEGVETEAELQIVSDLGCECVQGFFFSKPKPFHEACLDAAQLEAEYGFSPVLWKGHEPRDRDVPLLARIRGRGTVA